jgi:hypothetical protein
MGLPAEAGVIDHHVLLANGGATQCLVAQSFWNTYKLFTLAWL